MEDTEVYDTEESPSCKKTVLPSTELAGLWCAPNMYMNTIPRESLIFEDNVKTDLLSSTEVSLELASQDVDPNLVSCPLLFVTIVKVGANKLALLHGPPGTGKTSLCRALANTLATKMTRASRASRVSRVSRAFTSGVLVEVNSNSLSSKWMGESGKMVQRLFDEVRAEMANPATFVIVLIDEVRELVAQGAGGVADQRQAERS